MSDNFGMVKSMVSLDAYIDRYVRIELRGSGNNLKSTCPIHEGDNPTAFSVRVNEGKWKCFTGMCGSGDVVDLHRALTKKKTGTEPTVKEALEFLAAEFSVPVDIKQSNAVSKARIYDALADLTEFLHTYSQGTTPDALLFQEYLAIRCLDTWAFAEMGLGLFPPSNKAVPLIQKAVKDQAALIEAGVLGRSGESGPLWCAMSGRLAIPLYDEQSRVLGYSSRAIEGIACNNGKSKYINSPNKGAYEKSEYIYGLDQVSEETELLVIGESPIDASVVTHHFAPKWVGVAACGTSFTDRHAELLGRTIGSLGGSASVTSLYDGDKAGRAAAAKGVGMVNHLGSRVNAAFMPDGLDPWEMAEEGTESFDPDPEALGNLIRQSAPLVMAAARATLRNIESDDEMTRRSEMVEWVKKAYKLIEGTSERDLLIHSTSAILGVTAQSIQKEMSGIRSKRSYAGEDALGDALKGVLSFLLSFGEDHAASILARLSAWTEGDHEVVRVLFDAETSIEQNALKLLTAHEFADEEIIPTLPAANPALIGNQLRSMGSAGMSWLLENEITDSELIMGFKAISFGSAKTRDHQRLALAWMIDSLADLF